MSKYLKGSQPFFYKRGKAGFLLIHGFTGSPWEMRFLGKKLYERGYTVLAPRLKGHGESPEALSRTTWFDWYESAKEGLKKIKKHCEEVYVTGLSMGGVLALHLAAHEEVDAVISLSAPFFLKDPKLLLLPLVRYFPLKYLYRYEKEIGRDIREEKAKQEMVCYQRTPVPAIVSLMDLLSHVKDDLREVEAPALLIHAQQDHLVPVGNLQFIYNRIQSPCRRALILKKSFHVVTVDVEKEKVAHEILKFVETVARGRKMR